MIPGTFRNLDFSKQKELIRLIFTREEIANWKLRLSQEERINPFLSVDKISNIFRGLSADKLMNDSEKYHLMRNLVGDYFYLNAISAWFNDRPEISLKEKLELMKLLLKKTISLKV